MTQVDREIGLALLKKLMQGGLITEDAYVRACNSRFFDSKNFIDYADLTQSNLKQGED